MVVSALIQLARDLQAATYLDASARTIGASSEGITGPTALGVGVLPVLTHSDHVAIQFLQAMSHHTYGDTPEQCYAMQT